MSRLRRNTGLLASLLLCCSVGLSCAGRPPAQVAQGERVEHEQSGFSLIAPPSWQVASTARGLSLVRTSPYGGGFPTLNIRRVTAGEAAVLHVVGSEVRRPAGKFTFRYQRWSNSRGQGYRLEAVLHSAGGLLFADASVWDSGGQINRRFFETEFWPILNSLEDQGPGATD